MPVLVIVGMDGEEFSWWRGSPPAGYSVKGEYLVPHGRLRKYRPNLGRLCEVLASLRHEADMLRFFSEHGPLGTYFYFLRDGRHEAYTKFAEGGGVRSGADCRLLWDQWFGLVRPDPAGAASGRSLLTYEPRNRGRAHDPADSGLWAVYREPLRLAKLALAEFQGAVRGALSGEHHYAQEFALRYVGGAFVARCSSLIEGALTRFLWDCGHGRSFVECVGVRRYGCATCRYGKMFFWKQSGSHVIGEPGCKVAQNARAKKSRTG